jgi:3-oxoacyl-[acyl-carrier-protein] synthase-3
MDYGEGGNPPDYNTPLFGDGSGVMVLVPEETDEKNPRGILASYFDSDVTYVNLLLMDAQHKTRMPGGPHVRKHGSRHMIDAVHKVMDIENERRKSLGLALLTKEDLKLIVPHQANGRMIDTVVESEFPGHPERIYRNIERYGNMSSATIAVGFAEAHEQGLIKKGDLVALTAVGSDMQWGATLLRL